MGLVGRDPMGRVVGGGDVASVDGGASRVFCSREVSMLSWRVFVGLGCLR